MSTKDRVAKLKLWAITSFSGCVLGLGAHSGSLAVLALGMFLLVFTFLLNW